MNSIMLFVTGMMLLLISYLIKLQRLPVKQKWYISDIFFILITLFFGCICIASSILIFYK